MTLLIDKLIVLNIIALITVAIYIHYTKFIVKDINSENGIVNNTIIKEPSFIDRLPNPFSMLRDYDYRTLSDPLVPPYKRDDYTFPLPTISTRGPPSAFKKIGLLVDSEGSNNDKYKFMTLMGRETYKGSNRYDYYVSASTDNNDNLIKFDLPNLHKEVSTGDTIRIDALNKSYDINVDRNLGFNYNPFYI